MDMEQELAEFFVAGRLFLISRVSPCLPRCPTDHDLGRARNPRHGPWGADPDQLGLPCRLFSKAVACTRHAQRQQPRLPPRPPLPARRSNQNRAPLLIESRSARAKRSSFPVAMYRARLGLFRREIVAAGSIHVYALGTSHGGSTGNTRARIFCSKNEAELISVEGYYRTAEQWMRAFAAGNPMLARDRVLSDSSLGLKAWGRKLDGQSPRVRGQGRSGQITSTAALGAALAQAGQKSR